MSKNDDDKLTPDERLQKALAGSGHNLHLKVVRILEDAGWHADISPYYCDDTTNKPREIDTVASKQFLVYDASGSAIANFTCRLFIECKHFTEEVAFRMMPRTLSTQTGIKYSNFRGYNVLAWLQEHHHYYRFPKVGKLSNMYNRGNDQNPLFEAITQPVKSLIFFGHGEPTDCLLYPITVYEGIDGIYELENDTNTLDRLNRKKHSLYEIYYSYRHPNNFADIRREIFLIDFVHLNEFQKFLQTIEQGVTIVKSMLQTPRGG